MKIKYILYLLLMSLLFFNSCSKARPSRLIIKVKPNIELFYKKISELAVKLQKQKQIPESNSIPAVYIEEQRKELVLGNERLFTEKYYSLIENKNVAIMANQTAHKTVNRLISDPRVNLAAIFAPEHGFRGEERAGQDIADDFYRDVPVFGRYGGGDETRRIPPALLENIDVLLFEIQDIGTRHYTFISSMYLAMDSAADAGIPFIVLDRPVGVNGQQIEGPLLEPAFQTFMGIACLPNRYAMTIGELALLFKNEQKIMHGPRYPRAEQGDEYYNIKDLELIVIPMENYNRALCYDEIFGKDSWVPSSPNVPNIEAALCYVGTGLLCGNSIKELVHGYNQFNYIALPFIKNTEDMKRFLEQAKSHYTFPGARLEIQEDTETGVANILFINITDRAKFNSSYTALALMYTQAKLYPELPFLTSAEARHMFTITHGNEWFLNDMLSNIDSLTFTQILDKAENGLAEFNNIREKYLLY